MESSLLPWSAVLGREDDKLEHLDTIQVSGKIREQAGAVLCQALVQVDLVAVFILQLNFRFGKHWKSEFSHV